MGNFVWAPLKPLTASSSSYCLHLLVTSVPHSASPIPLSHLPLPSYLSPPHTCPPLSQVSCPHSLHPSYFLTPVPPMLHATSTCVLSIFPWHSSSCHTSTPPGASTSAPLSPHCWHHRPPHQILVHVRRSDPLVAIQRSSSGQGKAATLSKKQS
jgi:hypothetical protein